MAPAVTVLRIATASGIRQTITARVEKQCPVKHETDYGTVTITYDVKGEAFELHSLAAYLDEFADIEISHEDFTRQLARELSASVKTSWNTAGMDVICEDHNVLR